MHKFIFFLGVIASAGLLSSEAGAVKKKTKGQAIEFLKITMKQVTVSNVSRQSNPTGSKTSVSGPLSSSGGTKGLTAPPSALSLSQPGLLGGSSTGSGGTTGGTFKRPTTTTAR